MPQQTTLLPVLVVASCIAIACSDRWSARGEFERNLRCGMTPRDVSEVSRQYGGGDVQPRPKAVTSEPNYYLGVDGDFYSFRFDQGRLRAYVHTSVDQFDSPPEPTKELCGQHTATNPSPH